MSRVMTVDGESVQFILNDTDGLNVDGLDDNIIYSDGTRAILVNNAGQFIERDMQTVVLQDSDLNQYYINNDNGEILIADEDSSINQPIEDSEVVQFIEDDGNITADPQIIYVNEEGCAINDTDLIQYQILEGEDADLLSQKGIKLETQVIDLDELMTHQSDNQAGVIENCNDANGYQYAILKDGKLHIQSYTGDILPIISTDDLQEQDCGVDPVTQNVNLDLSRITGRNLLTGQTVTLHNYMDKLNKKIKDTDLSKPLSEDAGIMRKRGKGSSAGLKGLLNKKLTLGKTSTGKRLVGKVIHVEKRTVDAVEDKETTNELLEGISEKIIDSYLPTDPIPLKEEGNINLGGLEESNDILEFDENDLTSLSVVDLPSETPEILTEKPPPPPPKSKRKVLIQEKLVSRECFSHICRTLSGLMNMDSVRKKLQYKNIIVKVVERKHDQTENGPTRSVSYCSGHMQEEFLVNDEGEMMENWSFVSDNSIQASIFEMGQEERRYLETTNITLIITYDQNNHRTIRVILNNGNGIRCSVCSKEFRTNLQLRVHLINAHSQKRTGQASKMCEVCSLQFDNADSLQEHRKTHIDEGKLFQCPVSECGKLFLTYRRLHRHSAVHNITSKPLECSVCLHKCSSETALKKHLMTHMKKNLSCDVCGKRFVNMGELNFHKRVHDPCKNYGCEICKRTFSRHSNLLRHIEIHKGSEELYQCTICGCSYHYMSSLTRHVVQNHIKRANADTPPALVGNSNTD